MRIAFIKFGGLSAGGTERWLQMFAANLPPQQFAVDYFYCNAAPYIGSDYRHADTDPDRLRYLIEHEIRPIEFEVEAKDITTPTHEWKGTNFWQIFNEQAYDMVVTGKCMSEYPYYLLKVPVIECRSLVGSLDTSANLAWTVHLSHMQQSSWIRIGGNLEKSSVIPIPVEAPATKEDMRQSLGISSEAIVAGFHQRNDDAIYSPIPLEAFSRVTKEDRHFIIMGGGESYRIQAERNHLKNVHFVPHSAKSKDISRFLNSLDFFAHGRRDGETFGTVLAEAMAHGKACLSHAATIGDNNAQSETMGPSGIFASNQRQYASYLERLFSDKKLRSDLSQKAAIHAQKYYSVDSCVDQFAQILLSVHFKSRSKADSNRISYSMSPFGYLRAFFFESKQIRSHTFEINDPDRDRAPRFLRFALSRARAIVDVGARTGFFSFYAARHANEKLEIVAYKPDLKSLPLIRETIWLNNWENRFHLLDHELQVSSDGLQRIFEQLNIPKIDVICCENPFSPDSDCFSDLKATILRDRPLFLFNPPIGEAVGQTLGLLRSQGYSLWTLTEKGQLRNTKSAALLEDSSLIFGKHRLSSIGFLARFRLWNLYLHTARKTMKTYGSFRVKFLSAIRNPKRAWRWLFGQIISRFSQFEKGLKKRTQNKSTSYQQHNAQMIEDGAFERHIQLFREFEAENHFNSPEMRLADLLEKHPIIRNQAIDIGCGVGWLSARLCKEGFLEVVGIEPSAAALEMANRIFPKTEYPNLRWINGFAEDILRAIKLSKPSLFVTGCVLAHLTDSAVEKICRAICRVAPVGSLLGFSEPWGPTFHEVLWHVRTEDWWRKKLKGWNLDFYGPGIENVPGRHKGFHGVKVF